MRRLLLIPVLCLLLDGQTDAQYNNLEVTGSARTCLSGDSVMPFWMVSNMNGKIPDHSSVQLLELGINSTDNKLIGKFKIDYGLDLVYTYAGRSELKAQEYFIRLKYKPLLLRIGAIQDSVRYNGLSSTNGSILYSDNFRPLPGIVFGTDGWFSVPYTRDYIKISLLYSESLTRDIRYVKGTRVHHKYAYGLFGGRLPVNLYFGLDHFVQWGGVSRDPDIGNLNPKSIKDYLLTIFPNSGADSTNPNDYLNARGNHIGGYDFGLIYKHKYFRLQLYHQTLAEDHSGLQLKNWRDGITGLFIESGKSGWLSSFIYEFYYTMHQGGAKHGNIDGKFYTGNDNYFNNTIYKSGWTNFGRTIGSPFFTAKPAGPGGYCLGIENNRFIAHHFGVSGNLDETLNYKVLVSTSRNYGTYSAPYKKMSGNVYSCLYLVKTFKAIQGLRFTTGFAVDFIESQTNHMGITVGLSYQYY